MSDFRKSDNHDSPDSFSSIYESPPQYIFSVHLIRNGTKFTNSSPYKRIVSEGAQNVPPPKQIEVKRWELLTRQLRLTFWLEVCTRICSLNLFIFWKYLEKHLSQYFLRRCRTTIFPALIYFWYITVKLGLRYLHFSQK